MSLTLSTITICIIVIRDCSGSGTLVVLKSLTKVELGICQAGLNTLIRQGERHATLNMCRGLLVLSLRIVGEGLYDRIRVSMSR